MGLNTSHPCPNCGNKTLTKRGITISYNSGREGGATWLDCINCEWSEKDAENDTEADALDNGGPS